MIRAIFITCFAIIAATQLSYAQDQDKVFNAASYTLDNGMQVVVIPNNRAPVVTHMVWYKVGAADEPMGKSGIAHFLEHLMFKGSTYKNATGETVTLEPGEFSNRIKSLGGRDNAFTSQDYTAYFQSIPSEHLEYVMRMEAGRMRGLILDENEILSERKVIIEERRQRTDNNPSAKFYEQMNAALYINHPYGIPVIGWENEMAQLTQDDARSMYKKYYAPNNAILIVTGDVTGDQVHKLAKNIYGLIEPSTDVKKRNRPISPPLPGAFHITVYDAQVRQPSVTLMARVPSANQDYKTSLSLEVMAQILGGGSTSRLYKSLVIDQKIATSAGMGYSAESLDDTDLYFYAVPKEGMNHQIVRNAIQVEIQKLINEGVTEEERKDAITRMQDSAIYARDSLSGPAMIIGRALSSGTPLKKVETWPSQLNAVTKDNITNAAKTFLDDKSDKAFLISGYLLPKPETAAATNTANDNAQTPTVPIEAIK